MQDSAVLPGRVTTAAGIGLLSVIGAVHLLYAPGYYVFVPYVGALFYATVGGVVVVAIGLMGGARVWGWTLGMLLAAAALAAYVVSRTIGLPMFPVLPWEDPFGQAALAAEALFLILGVIVLRTPARAVKSHHRTTVAEIRKIDKHDASQARALVGTDDRRVG
jgi:hypothetical protein